MRPSVCNGLPCQWKAGHVAGKVEDIDEWAELVAGEAELHTLQETMLKVIFGSNHWKILQQNLDCLNVKRPKYQFYKGPTDSHELLYFLHKISLFVKEMKNEHLLEPKNVADVK